jgi:hypothetical protein
VEFQVEDDVEAQIRESCNRSRTLRRKELASDFEHPGCFAQFPRQSSRWTKPVQV